jgi:HlyD family secretion protein
MTATVNVVTEEHRDVLLVPAAALMPAGERKALYSVVDGRARLDTVETGGSDGKVVRLTGGTRLTEGARVILQPPAGLSDGARVRGE